MSRKMLLYNPLSFMIFCIASCILTTSWTNTTNASNHEEEKAMLENAKLYTAYKGQLMTALKDGLAVSEKLGQLLSGAGGAFAGLSAVFSLIQLFTGGTESQELQEIKKGFAEMHTRFEKVERLLDELRDFSEYVALKTEYRRDFVKVKAVLLFLMNMRSNASIASFRGWCTSSELNGEIIISNLYHHVVPQPTRIGLFQAVFNVIKYGRKELEMWSKSFLLDAHEAMEIIQACMGVTGYDKKEKSDKAAVHQRMLLEMFAVIKDAQDKVETQFGDQAEKETIELLYTYRDASHEDFGKKLYAALAQKYFWVSWLVKSYGDNVHGHGYHQARWGNARFIIRKHGKTVFIAWCNTNNKPAIHYEMQLYKDREAEAHEKFDEICSLQPAYDYEDFEKKCQQAADAFQQIQDLAKQRFGDFFEKAGPGYDSASYNDVGAYIKRYLENGSLCMGDEKARDMLFRAMEYPFVANSARASHIIIFDRTHDGVLVTGNAPCFVNLKICQGTKHIKGFLGLPRKVTYWYDFILVL